MRNTKSRILGFILAAAMLTGCGESSSSVKDNSSSSKESSSIDSMVSQNDQKTTTTAESSELTTSESSEAESSSVKESETNSSEFDSSKIPELKRKLGTASRTDGNGRILCRVAFKEGEVNTESSMRSNLSGGLYHLDDDKEVLKVNKSDAGFDFKGLPNYTIDGSRLEDAKKVEGSDTIYLERGEAFTSKRAKIYETYYEDHFVTGVCFDRNKIKDLNKYEFADSGEEGSDLYKLGYSKVQVESIIGKGYDYGDFSFYKYYSENDEIYYYQIIEYKNGEVERVYILNHEP